jgi:hypothetical protein
METKICTKCKKEKDICEFGNHKKNKDGKRYSCKECENTESRKWKENNKDKVLEYSKIYNIRRLELNKTQSKSNKEKFLESQKRYYNNNKEKVIKRIVEYQKNKIKEDNLFKLKKTIQRTIRRYIKNKKFTTTEIIGCDYESFKIYFESLFTEGMSWDKLGYEIHIDHIIPLSSAKTEDDLYKLNHYTNLQPLWAKDNLIKGSKLL